MLPLYLLSALLGYLLGSCPTGYLVGRSRGIDIREHGSGNIGATNVVRVLGKKLGYFVFACDALKGFFAVSLGYYLIQWPGLLNLRRGLENGLDPIALQGGYGEVTSAAITGAIVAALACILGHNFPVWLRFKGGKGVATTVGVLLGLMPAAVGVAAVVWAASFYLFRFVSLASLLGALVLPVTVWFLTNRGGHAAVHDPLFWFSMAAGTLIVWRHRTNITRLLKGTEPRFARRPPANSPPAA